MKITTKNYFKAIKEVGFENLPEVLKKSHLVMMTKTDEGKDWSIYDNDADVKRVFDLAFEKLEEFIDDKGDLSGVNEHPSIIRAKQDAEGYKHLPLDKIKMIYRLELDAEQEDGLTDEIKIRKPALEKAIAEKEGEKTPEKQESTLAMKFVKRFLLLSGKTHQKKEIEGFLNNVQDAIKEKEIVKDDALSKEVLLVQNKLLSLVNSMSKSIKVELSPATKKQFQLAINKLKVKPKKKGLNGVGEEETKPKQNLMSSIEFANLHFNSIGFTGKWLDLIGDPSPGFTAMVFGKPKMGKSYLCVDFAGYLARNHGTVLYVANEEKLDATLQMKLNDKDVKHENLFVSDYLPEDLSKYKFIILDSVNKLGLNPKDLDNLKRKNPGKSFIFIFQTTKDGNFKGANSYQHDVDVVIEIPEKGKATQFGRFNAGGEMNIFEDAPVGETDELNGTKKNEKKKTAKAKDWTEPEWLDQADWQSLKRIKKHFDKGEYKEAMNYAMDCDTVIREEIPGDIWKKMGGQLTKTGEEKLKSKKEQETEDWTQAKHLDSMQRSHLMRIEKLFEEGNIREAMRQAAFLDAVERETIPHNIWKKMGGEINEKGKLKLKLASNFDSRPDDLNPKFIFSQVPTIILLEALNEGFDLKGFIRAELANRGQDAEGNWVGFDEAAKIHKIKK